MSVQVESSETQRSEARNANQSTVITRTISEENKSLFDFMKRKYLEEGFIMVGKEKATPIKSFWSFFIGERTLYTASFEKAKSE